MPPWAKWEARWKKHSKGKRWCQSAPAETINWHFAYIQSMLNMQHVYSWSFVCACIQSVLTMHTCTQLVLCLYMSTIGDYYVNMYRVRELPTNTHGYDIAHKNSHNKWVWTALWLVAINCFCHFAVEMWEWGGRNRDGPSK